MPHPNNTTYHLEDLFDEDLDVLSNFMWTLVKLRLASEDDNWAIHYLRHDRQTMRIGEI